MKTNDIKKALQTGEIDAGIVASLAGMEELQQTPLFYEQFFAYVSREDALFNNEVIRTSDLNGEQLWLCLLYTSSEPPTVMWVLPMLTVSIINKALLCSAI